VSEITLETAGNRSENDEKKFQMKNRCGNDFQFSMRKARKMANHMHKNSNGISAEKGKD
jgi:hypothetical protein